MRTLLNILAVIIGVAGGLVGLVCAAVCLAIVTTLVFRSDNAPPLLPGLIVFGIGAGMAFLGFLIASRALRHLKHPDAGTVRDMIGTAIYLIVMAGVLPLGTQFHAPGSLLLALIVGLYLFHRALVKRINARAFPSPATESQP